jgi:hypothetical protein
MRSTECHLLVFDCFHIKNNALNIFYLQNSPKCVDFYRLLLKKFLEVIFPDLLAAGGSAPTHPRGGEGRDYASWVHPPFRFYVHPQLQNLRYNPAWHELGGATPGPPWPPTPLVWMQSSLIYLRFHWHLKFVVPADNYPKTHLCV